MSPLHEAIDEEEYMRRRKGRLEASFFFLFFCIALPCWSVGVLVLHYC